MALTWKDWVKQAVSAGGTGALTLGAASSGYQAFAAGDDGKLFPYSIQDGTAWETGYGTYTHAGTTFARTSRTDSSTGAALNVSASAFLWVDLVSNVAAMTNIGATGVRPGGRLTLTSGTPVTTSDVTGATSIYYTPYLSNVICLWDGNVWKPVEFAEVTLALGTLTSAKPYDVFGYLSSGALATELLAWTSDTTRATAVTLQDGRYCKSGAKDRLYLGTFYTTATTTTEDSGGFSTTNVGGKRFLWNMYNRVPRWMGVKDTTDSWSYLTNTIRQARATAGNKIELIVGQSEDVVCAVARGVVYIQSNGSVAAKSGVGIDSTTTFSGTVQGGYNSNNVALYAPVSGDYQGMLAVGYHYISWNESGSNAGTSTFLGDNAGDSQQTGLLAMVMA